MRILYVAPRYHTNQHPIVAALQGHGHTVHFLVQYKGQSEDYSLLEPERIPYAIGFRLVKWLVKGGQRDIDFESRYGLPALLPLYRKIRRIDPDLVILRNSNWIAMGAFLVAKALGKPVLFYTQGPLHGPLSRRRRLLYRLYRTFLRGPIPEITPVLGDPHRATKGNPHAHYLPFVAPQAHQKDAHAFCSEGRCHILAIGKFEPRKNHLLLLQALVHLRRQMPDRFPVRLTLIGEVSTPKHTAHLHEVETFIARHDLQNYVDIRRNLPYRQVQDEYLRHDLFVLPSRDEPASIAVLEAMAHGLPVISSTANGTSGYIQPGKNGYIVQSDSLDDLIDKLACLLDDKETLIQMGAHSYYLAHTIYNGSAYCTALIGIAQRYFGSHLAGHRAGPEEHAP